MYRIGKVQEIDPENARVRVFFEEINFQSYWFQLMMPNTQEDKYYRMPSLEEYVVCLTDERCEAGVVIGSIYTAKNPPLINDENVVSMQFGDDLAVSYDKSEKKLTLENVGDTDFNNQGGINIKSDKKLVINIKEDIEIETGANVSIKCNEAKIDADKVKLGKGASYEVVHAGSPCPLFGVTHFNTSKCVTVAE